MSLRNNILLFSNLICFFAFGQTSNEFKNLLKILKPKALPTCFAYSLDEQKYFGAVYHVDTVLVKYDDSTKMELQEVYETTKYNKDPSLKLSPSFIKTYINTDTESLNDTENSAEDNSENSSYYAINLILKNKTIYAMTYERIFKSQGIPSSEKILCTYNLNGKLVSKIKVASFIFSGTGTGESGAKVPWFPIQKSCIDKNLIVKFDIGSKYKIGADGKIVETK